MLGSQTQLGALREVNTSASVARSSYLRRCRRASDTEEHGNQRGSKTGKNKERTESIFRSGLCNTTTLVIFFSLMTSIFKDKAAGIIRFIYMTTKTLLTVN